MPEEPKSFRRVTRSVFSTGRSVGKVCMELSEQKRWQPPFFLFAGECFVEVEDS